MVAASRSLSPDRHTDALHAAVRRTLAYADIFAYPLTLGELHRYLHGEEATWAEVRALLAEDIPGVVAHGSFYALPGRQWTVAERQRREAVSIPLAARACLYARLLRYLPFVRMVGLTGSLSMQNVEARGDIDLMVVAAPGRVWLCRAAVIALVHIARLAGDVLCPNYVVAEDHLALDDASIYGAHELAQMIPLYGRDVYRRLWASNGRVTVHLPNAQPWIVPADRSSPIGNLLKRGVERLLGGAWGDRLESWERRRKTIRLRRRQPGVASGEIILSPDQCKGHFGQHRGRVLAAYRERLARMDDGTRAAQRRPSAERGERRGR